MIASVQPLSAAFVQVPTPTGGRPVSTGGGTTQVPLGPLTAGGTQLGGGAGGKNTAQITAPTPSAAIMARTSSGRRPRRRPRNRDHHDGGGGVGPPGSGRPTVVDVGRAGPLGGTLGHGRARVAVADRRGAGLLLHQHAEHRDPRRPAHQVDAELRGLGPRGGPGRGRQPHGIDQPRRAAGPAPDQLLQLGAADRHRPPPALPARRNRHRGRHRGLGRQPLFDQPGLGADLHGQLAIVHDLRQHRVCRRARGDSTSSVINRASRRSNSSPPT